jgi:F-type H+-transporting ATPase subunit b
VKLDWSTIILEVFNFLILVWILKRFLYRPVLEVIARRRANVDKTLADAERMHRESEALKQDYETRVASWPKEREQAQAALREDLQTLRGREMEALRAALAEERKKQEVLEARRLEEQASIAERAAVDHGARFASRLLSRIASPDVEVRLVGVFLEDLARQPADKQRELRDAAEAMDGPLRIASAYPLNDALRTRISGGLSAFLGRKVACEFSEEKELLAGVRVGIGPWTLQADLQSELKMFRDSAEGAS